MLDEEFNKKYPLTKYHGIHNDNGRIGALFTNPKVKPQMYAVDEWELHDCVLMCRDHKRVYPQDNSNLMELNVHEVALKAVQSEKRRLGISLERPPLDELPKLTLVLGGLSDSP